MVRNINRTFVVLGMHRSGTSLLAGGLQAMDIDMGKKLLPASPFNPKGHFENEDFVKLNDEILQAAGGSWDNPPTEEAILSVRQQFDDKIKKTVEKHQKKLWGWKDPRTTLTIKLYLPYLEHPFFITCFRKSEEVALSLYRRDKMPKQKGIQLAKIYNDRLLKFITDFLYS